jgi:hypothetical protein
MLKAPAKATSNEGLTIPNILRATQVFAACGKNLLCLESGKKASQFRMSSRGKNMLCFKCGKKATQFRMSSCGKNMLCFKCGKKASLWEKTCSIWKIGKTYSV